MHKYKKIENVLRLLRVRVYVWKHVAQKENKRCCYWRWAIAVVPRVCVCVAMRLNLNRIFSIFSVCTSVWSVCDDDDDNDRPTDQPTNI